MLLTERKKVLITGGGGFIGSHLVRRLLDLDHEVLVLDNFSSGCISNLTDIIDNKSLRVIDKCVTEDFDYQVDWVFNLACPASPVRYQISPVKTAITNAIGVKNVLDMALKRGCRVLQASTSEVYGDPDKHPQNEDYWGNVNPIGSRSCYDEGKRFAETLCTDYARSFGVDVRIARIFNTYGPRMQVDDGRVISNFIVQALRGQCLTVYGDGSQTRSFCFVSDLVDGLIRLMSADTASVKPINLGNPLETTMLELARVILSLTGSTEERLVFDKLPNDDPKRRCPDIHRAIESLDWMPLVGLDRGLELTIEYFRRAILSGWERN